MRCCITTALVHPKDVSLLEEGNFLVTKIPHCAACSVILEATGGPRIGAVF